MRLPLVPIKHSIATRLLKVVFGIYLIVAVALTLIYMNAEYNRAKTEILTDLVALEKTITPSLRQALKAENQPVVQATLDSLVLLPVVVGLQIRTPQGRVIEEVGEVFNLSESGLTYNLFFKQGLEESPSGLIWNTFRIEATQNKQTTFLAIVTLYSSDTVLFNKVQDSFLGLILMAAIKVIVFWLIFLWIFRRFFSRPLAELAQSTRQMDWEQLETVKFQIEANPTDEIKALERVLNQMVQKLLETRDANYENKGNQKQQEPPQVAQTPDPPSLPDTALNITEAESKALFAGMSDIVFLMNDEGRYLKIAPTSPELLYKSADRLLGKTLHEVFPKPQADNFLRHVRHSLKSQKILHIEYWLEIHDKQVWFDGVISPMPDNQVVFVARDITPRKQFEKQLLIAKEKAEAANQAKTVFLANMSHELRTPLNAILGFSQIMSHSPNLLPEQKENLKIINRSGEHLLTLINDVLDMSKIEAGQINLNNLDFDLYRLLDDMRDMFKLRAEKKGLHIRFIWDTSLPQWIFADEAKLRQILINLIGNAIKFTQHGEVVLRVRLGSPKDQNALLAMQMDPTAGVEGGAQRALIALTFEVQDSGSGIKPSEIESLFAPFFQTQIGQKMREGTGLGLPITRKFVELMGGNIQVDSQLGKGSQFYFTIQVLDGMASQESQKAMTRVLAIKSNQKFRALIVDDIETNRRVLSHMLAPIGFEIGEAENGKRAIALWKSWSAKGQPPHLVWMDMRMPEMDGYEATQKIKALDKKATIIGISASAFDEKRDQAFAAGCDDYVRKPFKESEIYDLIQKHLSIEYIYETPASVPPTEPQELDHAVLTPDNLAALPMEWKQAMKQAIEHLDPDRMQTLIEQLREEHGMMAAVIQQRIDQFDYETIMALMSS